MRLSTESSKKRTEIYGLDITGAQLREMGVNTQIEKAHYQKGLAEIEKDRNCLEELLWVME